MTNMIQFIKTRTSTGAVICKKEITPNWFETYHEVCVFSWGMSPECYDENGNRVPYWAHPTKRVTNPKAKKMVCVDRQRDITVTLIKH